MDKNVLSCSKCGHTVNEAAESCAYCGTPIAAGDSSLPPDEETTAIEAQAAEPSPETENESSLDLSMSEEAAGKSKDPGATSDASADAAAAADLDLDNQLSDFDDNIDFQLPDDELVMEMNSEDKAKDSETANNDKPETVAASGPELEPAPPAGQDNIVQLEQQAAGETAEVIPLADKVTGKAAADSAPDLPETSVLEETAEDRSESETLGADILELVQDDASEQDSTEEPASDKLKAEGDPAAGKGQDETPASSGIDDELEAIMLAPADEDQSPKQPPSADGDIAPAAAESDAPIDLAAPAVGDATKSEDSSNTGKDTAGADVIQKQAVQQATIEAGKIDNASQEPAESKKKQKPAADAKALKKQKAALAKAKLLKAKKLKLAKAQALKKKKLKLAKAQALKKQKAAQADIETATGEVAAGSKSKKAGNPGRGMTGMDANTKMLALLKKYEGQAIGINYDNSADIKEAQLVEANDEFFSVFVKEKELNYNHPLKTILTIIEGQDGVETGESEQKGKFKAVVKVYPLVLF